MARRLRRWLQGFQPHLTFQILHSFVPFAKGSVPPYANAWLPRPGGAGLARVGPVTPSACLPLDRATDQGHALCDSGLTGPRADVAISTTHSDATSAGCEIAISCRRPWTPMQDNSLPHRDPGRFVRRAQRRGRICRRSCRHESRTALVVTTHDTPT